MDSYEFNYGPWSRLLLVKGLIGDIKVTLANVYAPNDHQEVFLSKILMKLTNFTEGHLILGGDLNVPLIPTKDTSSGQSSIFLSSRKRITASLHKNQLVDV